MISNTFAVIVVFVKSITSRRAIKEAIRLTTVESTFDSGNKYLGIYTFFISELPLITEFIALFVDSEKKL